MTHPMQNGMPVWPGHPVFRQTPVSRIEDGAVACNHALHLSEHSGTHFDAPAHFIAGATTIDAVPLASFFGRMLRIDATGSAPDSDLPAAAILAFEAAHGPVRPQDAVMFHFGWDRFWAHPTQGDRFLCDWPGLSGAAADLLVARQVRIVGTDCLSVDRFSSTDFPAHRRLLAAGILIGENFANLGLIPPVCRLTTLPLRIAGGSGAPLRAVAHVGRDPETGG
jgi:kynurenine formamidase